MVTRESENKHGKTELANQTVNHKRAKYPGKLNQVLFLFLFNRNFEWDYLETTEHWYIRSQ